MLTLSPSAVTAVGSLLQEPEIPDEAGLRIAAAAPQDGVEPGTQLSVSLVAEPLADDVVLEEEGARVFVGADAVPLIADAQLDAETREDGIVFGLTPREA